MAHPVEVVLHGEDIRRLLIGSDGVEDRHDQGVMFATKNLRKNTYTSVNYVTSPHFGYDEYRESMFRFSIARRLSRFWSLGVSLQYVLLQSELFERDVARIAVDVGAAFHPSDDWLIALSVINFPSVSIGERETNGKNPTMRRVLLGMNYWVAEKVLFLVGMETCKEVPFSFSAGMEYEAFTDFRIRSGISTHPFLPSAGVSYTLVGLTADVAFWYHPALGAGSGFGLSFSF